MDPIIFFLILVAPHTQRNLISLIDLIFAFLLLAVAGALIFYEYYYSTANILLRKLKNAPGKKIHEFRDKQLGKVVGKVAEHKAFLNAPLTNRRCVYYKVVVKRKKGGDEHKYWEHIFTDIEGVDFLVDQDGEKALVKQDFLESILEENVTYHSGLLNNPSPRLLKYLRSYGVTNTDFLGLNKTFQYHETILQVGKKIAVMGHANWEDPDPTTDSHKRLVFKGSDASPVYVSDYLNTLT